MIFSLLNSDNQNYLGKTFFKRKQFFSLKDNHLMTRGKPAKVSETGKPPKTSSVPLQDKAPGDVMPPQPKVEGRHSLFTLMEVEQEAKVEKQEGDLADIDKKDTSIATIRGKPYMPKAPEGKPAASTKNIEDMDKKILEKSGKSVVQGTKQKYDNKIWSLKQWMKDVYGEDEGDRPMEELDFRRFLVTGKDGKGIRAPNTIKVWRAAWGFWQDIDPDFDIDFDPVEARRTKRLIKGLRYNAGDGQEVDAADPIDSGRLWKMVDVLLEWGYPAYALYFLMIFYGGFRTIKAKNIKVKDCRKDTDKGTLIFTDRMKALNAETIGKVGLKQNYKNADHIAEFLDKCTKGKDPEEPLFDVDERMANELIKRVAAAHHWGEGKWVVYSLRHGMSLEAKAVLEGMPNMEVIEKAVEQNNLSTVMGHTNKASKKSYGKKKAPTKSKGRKKPQKVEKSLGKAIVVQSTVCTALKQRKK